MKNLLKMMMVLLISVSFLKAELVEQSGEKDGYDVILTTKKSLVVGDNEFFVELQKDEKVVTTAKVKAKFFMPEMPGMPYMEYEDNAVLENGIYKMEINFSMGGTWQYHIKFKTDDGIVHTIRGSVNL
ncbi:FixH family protein [Arcobacter aquimarinus]|uniref:Copper resistance protein n=1 Tax=Arcobacter aquimarinus TaxID=1315211 RepID=A0AAE7B3J6_9BACT|nr:FixH family protein [Arcobacter aquimarinus]QKE24845.1 putative copper resistance protein [Arcobacter aquimarinus]RXI35423.1 hypothetical protein CP986_06890 [Arcobacter aquimarinus]